MRTTLRSRLALPLGMAVALLALPLLGPGCITPPAVPAAGLPRLDLLPFPPGTEAVELPCGDGRVLRGVFVPGGTGAPVVVLLPGAGESITLGSRYDVRLGTLASDTGRWDDTTSLSGGSVTLSGPTAPEGPPLLRVRATLGTAQDGLSKEVSFGGLGVDLAAELGGRELPLGWRVLDELAALGIACLCVDWGGVGASGGERDPDLLVADAEAAFAEALRRAGGDPGRVAVRAHSLGTLPAGALLRHGPAGLVLVAPVRGETVVGHFLDWTHAPWWQHALLPLAAPVTDVDLLGQLATTDTPRQVHLGDRDALLDEAERARLAECCAPPGGMLVRHALGHEELVLTARGLLPGEADFYRRLFPDRPPVADFVRAALDTAGVADTGLADVGSQAQQRLQQLAALGRLPAAPLAAALALDEHGLARRDELHAWLAGLPPERIAPLDLDAARALLDLDDAGGDFTAGELAAWSTLLAASPLSELPALATALLAEPGLVGLSMSSTRDGSRTTLSMDASAGRPGFRVEFSPQGIDVAGAPGVLVLSARHQRVQEMEALGLDRASAERRQLRRLLKASGVPDRVQADGSLLAWRDGEWLTFPDGWR